ncbi:MAG: hypothetical protein ACTSU2_05905 [Promethearchaeota archaeon]
MVKVAFMQLSSCWGCHQSLVNAHLDLLPVLPNLEIVYWPTIVDFKLESLKNRKDGEIAVGFIEGAIRNEQDRQNTLLMRKKCQIIVAFGTCANFGGVLGLANLFDREELLKAKFVDEPSIVESEVPGKWPNEYITETTDRVYTVPQIIDVDVKLPGCPPTSDNIISAIAYILSLLSPPSSKVDKSKSFCEECALNNENCLLEKGILCFGPITAAGCSLKCPERGIPCVGCFRNTDKVGDKYDKLIKLLGDKEDLDITSAVDLKKFMELYLNLPNLEHIYFKGDPLQVLAKDPERFEEKIVNGHKLLVANPTGNEKIDTVLGMILLKLRDSKKLEYSQKSVCSHCNRKVADKTYTEIKRDYEGIPDPDICFLEQGYICMGPVTHAGCGTICPNKANAPCLGCYGPLDTQKDQGASFLTMYAALAKCTPEEIKSKILDPAGLFYRFSLASSILGGKVNDKKED